MGLVIMKKCGIFGLLNNNEQDTIAYIHSYK